MRKTLAFVAAFALTAGVGFAMPPAPGSHGWCRDECAGPYFFIYDNLYDICRLGGGGMLDCEYEALEQADTWAAECYSDCTGDTSCGANPWC
jgi:hypothetical protein